MECLNSCGVFSVLSIQQQQTPFFAINMDLLQSEIFWDRIYGHSSASIYISPDFIEIKTKQGLDQVL